MKSIKERVWQESILAMLLFLLLCWAAKPVYGQEPAEEMDIEVQLLYALGIAQGYEDGTFRLDQEITRAECGVLLLRAMGLPGMEKNTLASSLFLDVPTEHWAAAAIDTAAKMGILNGYGDGNFGPEDSVTCEQALKLCVSALGYQERAMEKGGYPSGYLAVANELELTEEFGNLDRPAKRQEVYHFVYQMLQADRLEKLGGDTYRKTECLLADVFHTYRLTETVTGADYMDISGSSTVRLREDEVKLGELKYRIGKTQIKDLFGLRVTAFYQEDSSTGIGVILACEPRDLTAQTTVIDADDIVSFSAEETETVILYEENNRIKTVRIPDSMQTVFNGKICKRTELIKPSMGKITISKGEEDGFALVEAYEDYVVKSVLEQNGYTIYAQFSKSLEMDKTGNSIASVWLDGEKVTAAEIQPGDVITAMRSLDGEVVTAYIIRDTRTGVLSEIEEENGRPYRLGIDGVKYELSADFFAASSADLPLGEERTFLLDKEGKIAFIEGLASGTAEGKYGYLTAAVYDKKGFGDTVQFRILSAENEILELKGAEKIRFRNYDGAEDRIEGKKVVDALYALSSSGKESVSDVVLYETNSQNEITQLYLPVDGPDDSRLSLDVKYGQRVFSGKQFTGYDGNYVADDNTIVFGVYDDIEYLDHFSAGPPRQFFSQGSSYQVKFFDVYHGKVGAVVYHKTMDVRMQYGLTERPIYIDNANSDVMLITDAAQVLDEQGDIVLQITGYVNGTLKSCIVAEEMKKETSLFAAGNVIQYETNYRELSYAVYKEEPKEQIVTAKLLFSLEDPQPVRMYNYSQVYNSYAEISAAYGRVLEEEDGHALLEVVDENGKTTEFPIVFQPFTYVYDARAGSRLIQPTVKEAVQVGREIFVRLRYQTLEEVVIVK